MPIPRRARTTADWSFFALCAGGLLAVAVFGPGCQTQSRSVIQPPRQTVTSTRTARPATESTVITNAESVSIAPDGTITAQNGEVHVNKTDPSVDTQNSVTYTGPSLSTTSDEAASSFESKTPQVTFPDGSSTEGGSTAISADLSKLAGGLGFFYAIGALFIALGAGLIFWAKQVKLGIASGVLGALFIGVGVTIATYPWIWLVVVAAGLGVGGYFLWAHRQAFKDRFTLERVVKGVENADPEARAKVTDAIKSEDDGAKGVVRATVDRVKLKVKG